MTSISCGKDESTYKIIKLCVCVRGISDKKNKIVGKRDPEGIDFSILSCERLFSLKKYMTPIVNFEGSMMTTYFLIKRKKCI